MANHFVEELIPGNIGVATRALANETRRKQEAAELKQAQAKGITFVSGPSDTLRRNIDGTDKLTISDLVFSMPSELSPPVAIKIRKEHINWRYQTLRTTSTQKVTSGHSQARINLSLFFVGEEAIRKGLRRLVATFNALPFVVVENSFIRTNLAPTGYDSVVCSLVSYTVSTVPNLPNTLAVDLDLLWFNYKPYAPNFWFREKWTSATSAPNTTKTSVDDNAKKAEGVNIASESDTDLFMPIPKAQPGLAYTSPTTSPARSEPLQQLITRSLVELESRGGTRATALLGNTVKLGYREYISVTGVDPQLRDIGKLDESLLKAPDSLYVNLANVTYKMDPEAADAFSRAAISFFSLFNKKLLVGSCFRTRAEQIDIYRRKPDLAAKPGTSWHEVGIAVDIDVDGLTKTQYMDLIRIAKGQGFMNLGYTSGYLPSWDAQGNPIPWHYLTNDELAAKGLPPNTKKRSDWEVWHFQHSPSIKKAKEEAGSKPAVQARIDKLYWGADPKANEKREAVDSEIARKLNQLENSKEWIVDSKATSSTKIVLYREKEFKIEERDQQLIPQSIAISKHNLIADLPIMGYEFSTQQYLGSSDMDAAITIAAVGENKLRELQAIAELTQRNQRTNRLVRSGAVFNVTNSVLNLVGFNRGVLEGIDSENVDGQPGLYNVVLRLSEYKEPQSHLTQTGYHPSYVWKTIASFMWNLLEKQRNSLTESYLMSVLFDAARKKASTDGDSAGSLGEGLLSQEAAARQVGQDIRMYHLYKYKLNDDVWSDLNVEKLLVTEWLPSGVAASIGGEQYKLKSSNLTEPLLAFVKVFAKIASPIVTTLHESLLLELGFDSNEHREFLDHVNVRRMKAIRESNPDYTNAGNLSIGTTFSLDGAYYEGGTTRARELQDMAQKYTNAPSPKELLYKAQLLSELKVATDLLFSNGAIDDPMFSSIRKSIGSSIELLQRGTQCYPDLDLPLHPLTGSAFDTTPDFWFYNESIDGALAVPTLKQELYEKAKDRLRLAYKSFEKFTDQEQFDKFYISYNQPDIKDAIQVVTEGEAKSRGNKKIRQTVGTIMPGEDSVGLNTHYEVKNEKINRVIQYDRKMNEANHLMYPQNHATLDPTGTVPFGHTPGGLGDVDPDEQKENEALRNPESPRLANMLNVAFANADQQIYNLARAYPTFKIYFLEDDSSDRSNLGTRNFDDFYSYSAIQDIRVLRNRKIPADLCVITISNIYGELDLLAFTDPKSETNKTSLNIVERFDPNTVNTELENPFSKLVVVEGSKIQLRLGYTNDPQGLETVFNGQVVEIGTATGSPDLIQLVCQGYAVELTAEEKYSDDIGAFDTTQELLSSLICSPEVTSFGRWQRTGVFDPKEIRKSYSGGATGHALWQFINDQKDKLLKQWSFLNKPQDDNIFAPNVQTYTDVAQKWMDWIGKYVPVSNVWDWLGLWEDDRKYRPWASTIWDIFKEMELRHPGFISSAVPYGNRMTMFFGPPDHRYWSRPLNIYEEQGWRRIKTLNAAVRVAQAAAALRAIRNRASPESLGTGPELRPIRMGFQPDTTAGPVGAIETNSRTVMSDVISYLAQSNNLVSGEEALKYGNLGAEYKTLLDWLVKGRHERYRPFRQYYLLSSEHNLIANNLTASAHGTFNAVELTYMEDDPGLDRVREEEKERELMEAISSDGDVMEMKADDSIEDKDTRVMRAVYPTCQGSYNARRYAVSLLMQSLRDVYKGELVVLGMPKVKPYDICFIYDSYRDMYGPVEVGSVQHIFSKETGFITEIKPDMITNHNNLTTMGTLEAMVEIMHGAYTDATDRYGESATNAGLAGVGLLGVATGGVGLALAAFGGYKITQWSQARMPIIITPVTIGYKPLLAGLNGYKRDSILVSLKGDWKRFTTDVKDGWNTFWDTGAVSKYFLEKVADIVE